MGAALTRAAPWWLATPSRFARLGRRNARLALLLLLAAMLLLLRAPGTGPDPNAGPIPADQTDLALYETIVDQVRHGAHYYEITARELRSRPGYPLRPFVTFRLPTLAQVQAWLPPVILFAWLFALVGAVALAWAMRLAEALPGWPARIVAMLLLAGGLIVSAQPALVVSQEIWAGLLIAWSLACWRPGRWIEAVALGACAMAIRETAAVYAIVMAGLALAEGRRRELLGWAAALAMLAAILAAHALAVSRVTTPFDPVSDGWSGLNGLWFYVMTLRHATVLEMFPWAIGAPVIVAALFGWAAWRDPLALRVTAMLAAYGVLIAVFARLNNFYWGLICAPVCLVGLAFLPDGLRDLLRQALDRRRITVTRVRA